MQEKFTTNQPNNGSLDGSSMQLYYHIRQELHMQQPIATNQHLVFLMK